MRDTQRDATTPRQTAMTKWTQRLTMVAAVFLITGCSTEPVQCGPCPPPASFYVEAGTQPAGTIIRVCMDGHGCTEQLFPRESDTSKTVQIAEGMTLENLASSDDYVSLDGAPVTATLIPPTKNAPTQTVTTTTSWHDGGDGVCACSYLSTKEPLTFT
jgi:hypothetical protein